MAHEPFNQSGCRPCRERAHCLQDTVQAKNEAETLAYQALGAAFASTLLGGTAGRGREAAD